MKTQDTEQPQIDLITDQLEKLQTLTLEDNARARIWRSALDKAQATPAPAPSFLNRFRWSFQAAISLLCILVFMFTPIRAISKAQESLPGEPLYRLKQASEYTRLQMLSPEKQQAVRVTLLERRIKEVEQLIAESRPIPEETLAELEAVFRVITVSPDLWQPKDKPLVTYLNQYEETLFNLAVEHRELYTLRYVYRASFYAKQQLENTAPRTNVAQHSAR